MTKRAPRCPSCGYTKRDCRELMDHRYCGKPDPAPACEACDDAGCGKCSASSFDDKKREMEPGKGGR